MVGGDLDYLMTSLPYLSFQNSEETRQRVLNLLHQYEGDEQHLVDPLTILNNEARKFLSPKEYDLFEEVNLKSIHNIPLEHQSNSVIADFAQFMLELRIALKELRDPESEKNQNREELNKIIGEGNPLVKEERLIAYQWQKLEDLAAGHFTDFEALLIYKLQLSLLLRWWSFNVEDGHSKFIQITSNQ